MTQQLKGYVCVSCLQKSIEDIDPLINVSHIRLRYGDTPEKYGWKFIDKKWTCRRCVELKKDN